VASLAALLEDAAAQFPERTALAHDAQRISYAELNQRASQVAGLLADHGIMPGDKVALSCPNLPYFTIIYFGILKSGAAVVPLNILLKPREIAYHLKDSQARAYFAFGGSPELPVGEMAREGFEAVPGCEVFFPIDAAPATAMSWSSRFPAAFETIRASDQDTAVILYTSGTTGQPKGAELTHRNLRENALAAQSVFGIDPTVPETFLCVLPLFHSFGQTCIQNTAVAAGGTVVLQPRFEARSALRLMTDYRVTFFAGVPTMYWGLLSALDDSVDVGKLTASLRVAASGGAAMPAEMHKDFKERFGVTVLEGYGLSETSPLACFSRFGEEPRTGSIGRPIPGVQMKLVNDDWSDLPDDPEAVGEIAIKGHNIMKGYYQRPGATAQALRDCWFRSGDLGRKDEDGFYYIVDRAKDLIIRGGFNIYPREVEEVLAEHPSVSLAAVIGVPSESHGEEIKAVVIKPPGDETTEQELIAWAKKRLAAYKYPRYVEFVRTLPMTSTGKILKREIKRSIE
jgi:long-chain acyl-CoA synthetase